MPPPKRRTQGGQPINEGRATRALDDTTPVQLLPDHDEVRPLTHTRSPNKPSSASRSVGSSQRYTPPVRSARFRATWHRLVGAGLLVVGVLVVILNDVMRLQPDLTLLPGGHNELYLVAGMASAAYSTWWFGWFDRKR